LAELPPEPPLPLTFPVPPLPLTFPVPPAPPEEESELVEPPQATTVETTESVTTKGARRRRARVTRDSSGFAAQAVPETDRTIRMRRRIARLTGALSNPRATRGYGPAAPIRARDIGNATPITSAN
jgi:hypothetical protein